MPLDTWVKAEPLPRKGLAAAKHYLGFHKYARRGHAVWEWGGIEVKVKLRRVRAIGVQMGADGRRLKVYVAEQMYVAKKDVEAALKRRGSA